MFSCGQNKIGEGAKADTDRLSATEEEEFDLAKLRKDYVLSYSKPIMFKSEHKGKDGERVEVIGKYYCLFDNGIAVPGKYNQDDTTKTFRTHNFAEDVIIIVKGDTSIRRTITKSDFESTLPKYLQRYAVLLEPRFEGYDSEAGVFDFNFSISIPLSDVGESRKLSILTDGTMKVQEPE